MSRFCRSLSLAAGAITVAISLVAGVAGGATPPAPQAVDTAAFAVG